MKKVILSSLMLILTISSLAACTNNRGLNTVGGAAIGGVAGNALTGGSTVGTVAGAIGGGVIGNQMSR